MNKSLSKLDFRVACCFNILIGIWHISLEHWKMLIRWCRNNIYSYKLSAKVSLMLDSPFLVPFLVNWTISVFVSSRLAQNYLQTAYSLQGKQCFFWSHPRCFGSLDKFQHIIKISIKTARVSRLCYTTEKRLIVEASL